MWGIFFGEFQCLPVDDFPAASCDSGVLVRGSESTSFYSAILVPPPGLLFKTVFLWAWGLYSSDLGNVETVGLIKTFPEL